MHFNEIVAKMWTTDLILRKQALYRLSHGAIKEKKLSPLYYLILGPHSTVWAIES